MSDQFSDSRNEEDFQGSPIKGERPPDKIANFRLKSKRRGPPESPSPKKNPFSKEKYFQESLNPTKLEATHSPSKPKIYVPLANKIISPKRVTYKRKLKEDDDELERELALLGIDFNAPAGPEVWLPLEPFDDVEKDPPSLKKYV